MKLTWGGFRGPLATDLEGGLGRLYRHISNWLCAHSPVLAAAGYSVQPLQQLFSSDAVLAAVTAVDLAAADAGEPREESSTSSSSS